MLKRKIRSYIHGHLASRNSKILVIDGARQIGKSYIIRDVATSLFQNYVEIPAEHGCRREIKGNEG